MADPLLALVAPVLWWGQRLRWKLTRPVLLGVRALVVVNGHVLLVRHTYREGWHLPGGGLKRGEQLEAAVRRELLEEAGAIPAAVHLFGVRSDLEAGRSDHHVVFLANEVEMVPWDSWEIAEVAWWPLDALPPGTTTAARAHVERFRRGGPPGGS